MPQIFVTLDLDEMLQLAEIARAENQERIADGGGREIGAATIAARLIRKGLHELKVKEK